MKKRLLFGPESAKEWSTAESTMEVSTAHTRSAKTSLHWHITVDHYAGEPNYPIGWPRAHYSFRDRSARDWSDWDFLQLWVYADTTRTNLPSEPAGMSLHTPDREGAFNRSLSELKPGKWVQIKIPLSQIPRNNDVRLIQFHIAESNYRHLDQLDFYFDDVALLRYAKPTLLDFAPEQAVMYGDAKQVPLRFQLAGVKPGESVEVRCTLRRGGKILAQTAMQAQRGTQRMLLELGQSPLEPGDYEVKALASGGDSVTATLRVVESPWQ